MATSPPTRPENDAEVLIQLLNAIAAFLHWLLEQENMFTYKEDLGILREAFDSGVGQPVKIVQSQLRELTDRQRAGLESAGLTGRSLEVKRTLLGFDFKRGRIKRIIQRINSILGSLSGVFPVADVIKEFKDQTEASIGDLDDREGPKSLADLGGRFW
jgi:hypothetical protein